LGFHAIGDGAIHEFLDTFERLQKDYPSLKERRIRLEHAQLVHPDDVPRLRDLGILISAQPSAMANPKKDASLLGEERAQRAYSYRSFLDAGVHLSFGSDMPGEPVFDPLLGIHHAVNRAGPERITPLEALRCYTMGSAYAEFKENEKGSIIPGKYADLVLLSQDPLTIPPEKIKETTVDMTMVGGKIVYTRK
jgi:predicted amidohydrolase YtcJ